MSVGLEHYLAALVAADHDVDLPLGGTSNLHTLQIEVQTPELMIYFCRILHSNLFFSKSTIAILVYFRDIFSKFKCCHHILWQHSVP